MLHVNLRLDLFGFQKLPAELVYLQSFYWKVLFPGKSTLT